MKKLQINDVSTDSLKAVTLQTASLPRDFGRDLSNVDRARLWLTNPANWHESNMFVLKWDGLVPSVSRHHGMRLVHETWDNGLPEVVVREQARLRAGGTKEEDVNDCEE